MQPERKPREKGRGPCPPLLEHRPSVRAYVSLVSILWPSGCITLCLSICGSELLNLKTTSNHPNHDRRPVSPSVSDVSGRVACSRADTAAAAATLICRDKLHHFLVVLVHHHHFLKTNACHARQQALFKCCRCGFLCH